MKTTLLDIQKAEPRLLDLGSAANYLGVSRSIVRQLVDSGQISRVLLPSQWYKLVRSALNCSPIAN